MKRTVAFGALWTASAAAAVGLGFLAVSFVDADRSPLPQPASATGSAAVTPSVPAVEDGTASVPAPEPPVAAPASGEYVTVGGTVYASCEGGVLQVAAAPAVGWWLDDQDHGGEVEFESPTQKVEVHVACTDGTPSFFDEGVRGDRNEPEDSSSSSPASAYPSAPVPGPASAGAGVDDSAGRVGGGHGSDDPPGDDSAGRVGGGHGSDDGPGDDRGRGRGSDD
ncbi:hypothetical protein ACI78V_07020 [Geodermatophilus sp. SYSU D00742]